MFSGTGELVLINGFVEASNSPGTAFDNLLEAKGFTLDTIITDCLASNGTLLSVLL